MNDIQQVIDIMNKDNEERLIAEAGRAPRERTVYRIGTTKWWGHTSFELEDFLSEHHAKTGELTQTNGYYLVYRNVECFAPVSLFMGKLHLKIMPLQVTDNIGNGCGVMERKEFLIENYK